MLYNISIQIVLSEYIKQRYLIISNSIVLTNANLFIHK